MSKKMENVQDIYPLTPTQMGMLYHVLSEPESEVYFEQMQCKLEGPLDVDKFIMAWQFVVDHHPALRTAFLWEKLDSPLQIVRQKASVPWQVFDWRDEIEDQEVRLEDLLYRCRVSGFDLTQAPLMNFILVRLTADTYQLIWNFHHLIMDGWSTHQVFDESLLVYEMLMKGQDPSLPPVKPFRTYLAWLKKQDPGLAESFWRQELAGFKAPTSFNVDRASLEKTIDHGEIVLELTVETTAAVKQFSQRERITLNTVLQGSWALLLSRYSGENDVVFGNTFSGRPVDIPGVEKMVGMFITTLPLRVQMSDEQTLVPWLQQLQEKHLAVRDYEFSPLVQVQQWSDLPPGEALFESLLVFENYPGSAVEQAISVHVKDVHYREQSNYPLAILVLPGDRLLLKAIYNRNRFEAVIIKRLLNHLEMVLKSIAAQPEISLGEVPLLTPAEQIQLLMTWNNTGVPQTQMRCLYRYIEDHAGSAPDATAVVANDRSLTYAELNNLSNQLANLLIDCGVKNGTTVGLYFERSAAMLVGILAVQKAGGAYVPLDPSYPSERIAFILNDLTAHVIVAQSHLVDRLPPNDATIVQVDPGYAALAEASAQPPEREVSLDSPAYVIYTSGSTGVPKGVIVTHGNLLTSTIARKEYYKEPVQRFLLISSLAFDSSVAGIFWTLADGGTLVLTEPDGEKDVHRLAEIIAREEVTHTLALPSLYRLLLSYAPANTLDSLQVVIVAGEACPPDLGRQHYDRLPRTALYNEYGPTEATVWCTVYHLPPEGEDGNVPIGRPIPGSQIYILDRWQRPVPIGVPGELYVGGEGVTAGYLNNPQLTAEKFLALEFDGLAADGRVYRTGDLARWRADGQIEFLGRVDNQVKIRGYRIEPGEIENVLLGHPSVQETAVTIWQQAENGPASEKSLIAYIVAGEQPGENPIDEPTLQAYLNGKLPDFMVPRQIILLPALPRTPNGKLDRSQLPPPDKARDTGKSFVAPRTAQEKNLSRIWSDVLQVQDVGIEDNFFELGGDSIMVIQVIARARQEGLYLTPRQVFQEQTIARLAAAASLEEALSPAAEEEKGPLPLTPIQHWFFSQDLKNPAHWNQASWFEVARETDLDHLSSALTRIVEHHPQLRARFRQLEGRWQQEVNSEAEPVMITHFELAGLDARAQDEEMLRKANQFHGTLDLDQGLLLRVLYFDLGNDRASRLLLIIHHLVVDTVSWGILLSDLAAAYGQISRGEALNLPASRTPYGQWAKTLAQIANGETMQGEAAYWLEMLHGRESLLLPRESGSGNTEGEAGLVTGVLDQAQTALLLRDVHKAYHTRIDDLLLAALARTMSNWAQNPSLLLTLERHGREEVAPQIDVSQTAGWFTCLFPMCLTPGDMADLGGSIRAIKEQLRAVPQNGIGYGMLRYLGPPEQRREFAALPKPQILFNYLGQKASAAESASPLRPLTVGIGHAYGPQNERYHLIDINARVEDGRLVVRWQYASRQFQEAEIEALAGAYIAELETLIAHCIQFDQTRYTPSDFPLAEIEQDDLDSLADLLDGLD